MRLTDKRRQVLELVNGGGVSRFVADESWWLGGGLRKADAQTCGALNWAREFGLAKWADGGRDQRSVRVVLTAKGRKVLDG